MPNQPQATPQNNEGHNADVASKLAAQDISGKSMSPAEAQDTASALDKLKAEAEQRAKDKAAAAATPAPEVEPKPDAAPKPADTKPADTKPAATPATPAPAPAPAAPDPAAKRAEELFKDSPALPSGASPKSSEAFAAVKIRAAQEITKLEQKVHELTKTATEQADKLKNPIPPEVARELEELRQFRAKLDVDIDPKFKEYDKAVTSAQEFIYAQLRKSPVITEDVIAQIKKHGGPENVNLTKIFEAVKDPTIQRLVEQKVSDIEQKKFDKDQAIKSTKENIGQYLSEREKSFKQSAGSHTTATKAELEKLTAGLTWFKDAAPEAGADAAAVKAAEDHNKFLADTRKQLNEALEDDSPEMRAIMLVGMLQLFNLQRVHTATKAEVDALKAQLAESTALTERLKAPSRSRLPESGAPANPPPAKAKDDFSANAGDALDKIRDQVIAARTQAQQ